MEYTVNGVTLKYEAVGARAHGNPSVLLDSATDLSEGTSWHPKGFTVEELFDDTTYASFRKAAYDLLIKSWKKAGLLIKNEIFRLDQYHTLIKDFKIHLQAIEYTKLLSVNDFPISIDRIERRISEICGLNLVALNPYDNQAIFHFRIIRPSLGDNNPLHRDVWLEDYDDCINLYIPIAGSDAQSSLILLPGSHRWPESKIERTESGAVIKGVKFNVPAVTAIDGSYEAIRPNPGENQVLVFSPYLIHGGAVNLNKDSTRISIELRLWKK